MHERRVVLVCGPPGAGKSTLAKSLGLPVFDLDDWAGTPESFRRRLAALGSDPSARAVVIRTDPFAGWAEVIGATETIVLDTPLEECIRRIRARKRKVPPIRHQIAATYDWWRNYEQNARAAGIVRRRRL